MLFTPTAATRVRRVQKLSTSLHRLMMAKNEGQTAVMVPSPCGPILVTKAAFTRLKSRRGYWAQKVFEARNQESGLQSKNPGCCP